MRAIRLYNGAAEAAQHNSLRQTLEMPASDIVGSRKFNDGVEAFATLWTRGTNCLIVKVNVGASATTDALKSAYLAP